MICGCYYDDLCEREQDDLNDRLLQVACAAGVHGTRTLGRCPHSPRSPLSPLYSFLITEALAQLRLSLAATRLINRAYDSRRQTPAEDFGPLGSAWTKDDLGRPA